MTKRVVFSVLLVVVLALSASVVAQETTIDEPMITPVVCDEPGDLTMWVWDEQWAEVIGNSIEVWTEKYCEGATVDLIQQPWGNYWDLLRTNAAGGDLPDVFNMSQTFVGFYAENDVLLNLQPYWDAAGIDTTMWGTGMVNPYRFGEDGDLHAGPVNWDTVAVLYNKEMLEAAGLEEPTSDWTWDDFAMYTEALTDEEAGVFGAAVYMQFQTGYANWIAATGESPAVAPERAGCTLTSDESLEALNYLHGLYDAGYMPSVSVMGGSNADDAFALFASENVAMITAGSWKMPDAIEQLTFDWDIVQLPRHPETGRSRSVLHAVGYVADANTSQPDLAANLITFLVSDEAQMFFAEAGGVAPANPNPVLQATWAEAFADSGKNVQAFIDATEDSQGVTGFGEIWNVINAELVINIFDLDIPVEDAAAMACEEIDRTIAELAE